MVIMLSNVYSINYQNINLTAPNSTSQITKFIINNNISIDNVNFQTDKLTLTNITYSTGDVLLTLDEYIIINETVNASDLPYVTGSYNSFYVINNDLNYNFSGRIDFNVVSTYDDALTNILYTSAVSSTEKSLDVNQDPGTINFEFVLPTIETGSNILAFTYYISYAKQEAENTTADVFTVVAIFIGLFIIASAGMGITMIMQGQLNAISITMVGTAIGLGIIAMIMWVMRYHLLQVF